MEKLPPTSYVRLVDIWLINGQLLPFLEVILLTLLELYREDVSAVNHHGTKRLTRNFIITQWKLHHGTDKRSLIVLKLFPETSVRSLLRKLLPRFRTKRS